MSKKFKLLIPCSEAGHTCDKTQYNEATFWEKVKLNIHLIYCRFCRKYSKNNGKLSKVMNDSNLEHLNQTEKETLKNNFKEELVKHN